MKTKRYETLTEAWPHLQIGDHVRTNADGVASMDNDEIVEGVIGEIREKTAVIFHNNPQYIGGWGRICPEEKGYKYGWAITKTNRAWIETGEPINNRFYSELNNDK